MSNTQDASHPVPGVVDLAAHSLRGRATSGVLKTGLSQLVRLLVQLASVVALSRLLLPRDFGLIAMASPVAAFAALFQDLGLSQAVVQKASITQAELSALFCLSLGMSVAVACVLLGISPAVSWFYGEPVAGVLTASLGLNVVLGGSASLHYALLNRRMQFGRLAVVDATAAVGGLAASLTGALLFHSVWALYAGGVVGSLIPAVGYWALSGWRPSWPRRGSEIGTACRFGANVTGFNLANFFSRNLDNVLIGRVWGENPLGLYDRAYKLLLLPLSQINWPIGKVMLPVLSQLVAQPDRYRQAYLRTNAQMLLVTLPGIAFMVGTADLLIPSLLGRQWHGAVPVFIALAMAGVLQVVNNPTGWLFMSQDRTREYFYWGLFSSLTCVTSFLIGLPYGPIGVAAAYATGELLRTPCLWWYATRRGPVRLTDFLVIAPLPFLGAAVSLAMVLAVRRILPFNTPLVLAVCLTTAYLASALILASCKQGRATISQSIAIMLHLMARITPLASVGKQAAG